MAILRQNLAPFGVIDLLPLNNSKKSILNNTV